MKIGARLGFWTYRLLSLLGPIAPNLVFRPQTPGYKFVLIFYVFIRFSSGFWIKRAFVCENWKQGSRVVTL